MTRRYPKLKVRKDGSAVLSGIHVDDLRSIFDAASIHHSTIEKNISDNAWVKRIRALIESVNPPQFDAGYDNVPVIRLTTSGRDYRMRRVSRKRKSRLEMKAFSDRLLNSAKS